MSFPEVPQDPRNPGGTPTPPAGGFPGPAPSGPPIAPPAQPAMTPPTAPAGYPASVGDTSFIGDGLGTQVSSTVEKKPSIAGRVGLVAAAVAIAGGGAFAVTTALEDAAGPSSPDEAVTQFFDALDDDDLLGMTEIMLPSERESLVEPTLDLLAELQRLDLVDPDMDPEATSSIDFSVSGLEFVATEIGDGVARVRLLDGVVSVSGSTDDLPIGGLIEEEMGEPMPTESINEEIVDFDDEEDAMFVVVEEDGSWYVSLWYTVAEYARDEAGEPIPDFGNGVEAIGAATPEGAVEDMIREAAELDLRGMMGLLDPAEFRALHDYAPLFLGEAESAVDELLSEAAAEGVEWSVDRVDARSIDRRGRTIVVIDGFAGSLRGEGETYSIDFGSECLSISGPDVDERFCQGDLEDELGMELEGFADFFDVEGGMTVVERDGRWFMSGVPSIIGIYTDILAELDAADLERIEQEFEALAEGGFGLFEEFSGGGEMIFEDIEPGVDDDPFFEDDPLVEDDEFIEIEVASEDAALFPEGFELYGNDPEWWWGFESELVPLGYTSAWTPDFDLVDVARFEAGSNAQLLADLEADERYEPFDLAGLPDGAAAYQYPDVDVMVVYGDLVISTWLGDEIDHLAAQVNYLAGN